MVPHWPLRATLQPLFAACTRLLKTLDLGRRETPNNPVLMLTTHPLQATGFVHLLYSQ